MKYETKQARTASHLKYVIPQGWPEYPNECPSDLKEFWNFREDLCVENALVQKGNRPLTLSDLHTHMLQIILQGPPWCRKVSVESYRLYRLAGHLKRYYEHDC